MKIIMLETYQGVGDSAILLDEGITVTILEQGERYEVGQNLGVWLVENGKAREIQPPAPRKVEPKQEQSVEAEKPRRKRGAG